MDDDAEIIAEFLVESHENLDQLDRDLVALEQDPGSRELVSSIFRAVHTIKGTSGFLALGRLERLSHAGENVLSRLRDGALVLDPTLTEVLLLTVDTLRALLARIEATGTDTDPAVPVDEVVARLERVLAPDAAPEPEPEPVPVPEPEPEPAPEPEAVPEPEPEAAPAPAPAPEAPAPEPADPADAGRRGVAESSVRVDVDLLDALVQLVGELVLTRNQVLQRAERSADVELARAAQRLDLVATDLQEHVMRTRMQPISQVLAKMPRLVRDVAHQLGREVDLVLEGQETELDRSLLEALRDPLTHLLRNAVDHGLEPPAERARAGKPPRGRLLVRALHDSGQVVVEVSDDGRGMDPARIADVAVRRGLLTTAEASRLEERDLLELVLRPGFSTAETVTHVSGRGVGMDVVATNVERIGGSIEVVSTPGAGTTFRIRIPLTLAIIPALVVAEGEERYALPQAGLLELVRLDGADLVHDLELVAGAPVLRLRGQLLPLVVLADVLGLPAPPLAELTVVVVQGDGVRFGLCVSTVHDTQEIVVKPVGRQLRGLATYAGATIMGDGRVALILDVNGLAPVAAAESLAAPEAAPTAPAEETTALLVVEVAPGRRAALPLAAITRLEEVPADTLEHAGTVEVVQCRGGILPLVRLAPLLGLPEPDPGPDHLTVVVHDGAQGPVGLVIDSVVDVVDEVVHLVPVGRRAGVLGTAVLHGRVTDLLDLDVVAAHLDTPAGTGGPR